MLSLRRLAVMWGLLLIPISGHAAPILPIVYDMRNGQTGSYQYWDQIYNGAGCVTCNLAALTGGTGDLTDGIIAVANWFVAEAPAGNGPYVGWTSIIPTITFHFASGVTINSMTIFVDDSNGFGGVSTPGSVSINGGAPIALADGATGAPLSFTFSGLGIGGDLGLQLFDGTAPWIFLSEVQFDGTSAVPGVPEPATLVLLGTGLAGLAARRRRARPPQVQHHTTSVV